MSKTLYNAACFTDIHFGRKNNSEMHNQDCLNFIDWFIDNVKKDKTIDHIIFLGDWHEHRSSINGLTMDYSLKGAQKLNALGIPVFIIVGNHDLYYRNNRSIFTSKMHEPLDNFTIVNSPTVFKEIGDNGSLICPYLFHDEYPDLIKYLDTPIWFGHFEFKGFVLTGDTVTMKHGPDANEYKNIKRIFCGHFHKRQRKKNVQYIGNTFPADFSDANDVERGMMIYDHKKDTTKFLDWVDCPKYIKTCLTDVEANPDKILLPNARIECLVDKVITFEEHNTIKQQYIDDYGLREFRLAESNELDEILAESEIDNIDELNTMSTSKVIKELIATIESDNIETLLLTEIYDEL